MLKRYHQKLERHMVVLRPGEYYVTDQDEIIATVLGSCISVCVKDEKNQIAGMNHFMLPGDLRQSDDFTTHSARYGMYAMELLLGEIISWAAIASISPPRYSAAGTCSNQWPKPSRTCPTPI